MDGKGIGLGVRAEGFVVQGDGLGFRVWGVGSLPARACSTVFPPSPFGVLVILKGE